MCKKKKKKTSRTYYFVRSLLLLPAALHQLSWVLDLLTCSQEHASKNWMLIMAPNALASLRFLFWTIMPLSSFKSPCEQYLGIQRWISWLSKHWSEKGVSKGGTRIIGRAVLIMSALTVRLHAHKCFRELWVGFTISCASLHCRKSHRGSKSWGI